jgi:hypothetical protein
MKIAYLKRRTIFGSSALTRNLGDGGTHTV